MHLFVWFALSKAKSSSLICGRGLRWTGLVPSGASPSNRTSGLYENSASIKKPTRYESILAAFSSV